MGLQDLKNAVYSTIHHKKPRLICLSSVASKKTGLAPIKVEVEFYGHGYVNGKVQPIRAYFRHHTGHSIPPNYWSASKEQVMTSFPEHSPINTAIRDKLNRISTVVNNYQRMIDDTAYGRGYETEIRELADYFPSLAPTRRQTIKGLTEYFDDFVSLLRAKKDLARGTIKEFVTVKNRLIEYEKFKNRKLFFIDVNLILCDELITYWSNTPHGKDKEGNDQYYTKSTIRKSFSVLKTLMRHYFDRHKLQGADKYEITEDFNHKKFGKISGVIEEPPLPLLRDEFNSLFKSNPKVDGDPRLTKVRLRFLLQCSVGCRVSDLGLLGKNKNKFNDQDIEYYPRKTKRAKPGTKNKVSVPYNKYSKYVLKKINYNIDKIKMSDQKYNEGIKDLFKALKLKTIITEAELTGHDGDKTYLKADHLSSHNGRDTFISLNVDNNVPVPILLGWVGQTKFEMLRKYYKQDKNTELEFMRKFNF